MNAKKMIFSMRSAVKHLALLALLVVFKKADGQQPQNTFTGGYHLRREMSSSSGMSTTTTTTTGDSSGRSDTLNKQKQDKRELRPPKHSKSKKGRKSSSDSKEDGEDRITMALDGIEVCVDKFVADLPDGEETVYIGGLLRCINDVVKDAANVSYMILPTVIQLLATALSPVFDVSAEGALDETQVATLFGEIATALGDATGPTDFENKCAAFVASLDVLKKDTERDDWTRVCSFIKNVYPLEKIFDW